MYRLAAYFRIWDVKGWLESITWSQLETWLEFMEDEPHGEERNDLRIGALASVIWNCNIDTKALGGPLQPLGYDTGWTRDRIAVLGLKPKGQGQGQDKNGAEPDINNPAGWGNFVTGLRDMASG